MKFDDNAGGDMYDEWPSVILDDRSLPIPLSAPIFRANNTALDDRNHRFAGPRWQPSRLIEAMGQEKGGNYR